MMNETNKDIEKKIRNKTSISNDWMKNGTRIKFHSQMYLNSL